MFKRFWWIFLVMIPVGAIAGLLVAAVVIYVMPKKYESEVVIEVKPLTPPRQPPFAMSPQSFGAEFEQIKSNKSLAKVVERLGLTTHWGVDKETAVRILNCIINTQKIRGTDLISIRVRHTNKQNARDIAMEIARSNLTQRGEQLQAEHEQKLKELDKSVCEQEDKVEALRKMSAGSHKTFNLFHYDFPKPAEDAPSSEDLIDAKRDFEREQELVQELKLNRSGNVVAAKMNRESVVIHEEPQISLATSSPNVALNLVLGTALGFLLSPLLSLPVILLLGRLIPARLAL